MFSLTDLFTPTFFMCLGVIVLIIAFVVIYFENKMREQNHKIASMLGIVSTLAEDMNGFKNRVNHFVIGGGGPGGGTAAMSLTPFQQEYNLGNVVIEQMENRNGLIDVSDDDDEDEDEDEESYSSDSESDTDSETSTDDQDEDVVYDDDDSNNAIDNDENKYIDSDNDSDIDSDSEDIIEEDNVESAQNIKVIKINILDKLVDNENDNDTDNKYFDEPELNLEELDCVLDVSNDIPEISEDYVQEVLDLKYETNIDNLTMVSPQQTTELKTISMNLGVESGVGSGVEADDHIDYKKLQLPKLRSMAVEKGLVTSAEAAKLKKPELLKMLEV
jgi:hypothetical protein